MTVKKIYLVGIRTRESYNIHRTNSEQEVICNLLTNIE